MAYVGVTLLGALVGLAIAGVPSGSNDAASQISSVADPESVDTAAAATTTTPVGAETTTTSAAPPASAAEAETTTSTTSVPTTSTTTSTSTTTTTTTVLLADRADVAVVAVNGANVAGLAGRTADLLTGLGYRQTRSTDGDVIAETTVIYFADGRIADAERVAVDIGLEDPQLLPLDDDVPFNVLTGDELVVYVGLDRA